MSKPLLANNYHHCWMLNPFAHPVACCLLLGVVAQSLKLVKLLHVHLHKA